MMTLPPHLGGHANITNLDRGVFEALCKKYEPKSFLDIGCGPGGMVRMAQERGLKAKGIDGDFTLSFDDIDVLVHDFVTGPAPLGEDFFDLGWSVEFLEHVHENYLDNMRPAFQACARVWITHALPNQHGHHHVNCKTPGYWIKKFRAWGFKPHMFDTHSLRGKASMKYSRRTGMLMIKR